ncbi:AraC family transcriptional regulator [Seonamhaeicola maritimus]|uniref:AraC family transcriptional regulator n=1 Tax=Seonamhaeicola maritimus TaxID=2591822 RepID=UPI002494F4AB|nr:AraC family transcriptional regulator [Seonamhaeicola maritimus]
MKAQLEHIPHELEGSIHAFKYVNSYFDAPWHYHEDYELTYISKSSGIRHIGNNIDNFSKGDLVLIGKNVPHNWKNEFNYSEGVESYCIQWKDDAFSSFLSETKSLKPIKKLLEISQSGIKFSDIEFSTKIGNRLAEIINFNPGKKLISLLDILYQLSEHQDKELLSIEGNLYQYSKKSNSRIKSILDFIEENYRRKIKIEELSAITYMTDGAFCKYFKKEFNRSFTNYLNEFRIRKVCILLQDTNDKLLDIAFRCGYENMSFFHRQFKKYIKMTPLEYKKKLYASNHQF